MANFLRDWLRNQRNEHRVIANSADHGNEQHQNSPQPSSSAPPTSSFTSPDEVVFTSEHFKLVVKKVSFKRQKNFKIQDAQFWLKIVPLQDQENPPLIEILDFLEDGFNFILQQIKSFFKPSEHRIAYLTLYQEPMVIF